MSCRLTLLLGCRDTLRYSLLFPFPLQQRSMFPLFALFFSSLTATAGLLDEGVRFTPLQ